MEAYSDTVDLYKSNFINPKRVLTNVEYARYWGNWAFEKKDDIILGQIT